MNAVNIEALEARAQEAEDHWRRGELDRALDIYREALARRLTATREAGTNLGAADLVVIERLADLSVLLGAFNEVEVALASIKLLEEQAAVAASSLGAAEESFRIAEVRYREGVADFETVLVSQNSLFSTRNAFLDNKLQRLNAVLSFYQALGGGGTAGDIAQYWGVTANGR